MEEKKFEIEDFMTDVQFRNWILNPNTELDEFWGKWLQNHPEHKHNFLLAKEMILNTEFQEFIPPNDAADRVLNKILKSTDIIQQDNKRRFWLDWRLGLKIAAAIILGVGIYFLVETQSFQGQEDSSAIAIIVKKNPAGRKSQIFLPDGSIVWLNSASSLKYAANFSGELRKIELEGEAFFDVEKDENKAFVVEANGLSVTALGTSFNVKSYSNYEKAEVALLEGSVKIDNVNSNDNLSTILKPNEFIEFDRSNQEMTKSSTDDIASRISWKDGIILFENASMSDVFERLETWYGVSINLNGTPNSTAWEYSSEFDNQSLDNVLRSISYSKGFQYTIDNNTITIKFN